MGGGGAAKGRDDDDAVRLARARELAAALLAPEHGRARAHRGGPGHRVGARDDAGRPTAASRRGHDRRAGRVRPSCDRDDAPRARRAVKSARLVGWPHPGPPVRRCAPGAHQGLGPVRTHHLLEQPRADRPRLPHRRRPAHRPRRPPGHEYLALDGGGERGRSRRARRAAANVHPHPRRWERPDHRGLRGLLRPGSAHPTAGHGPPHGLGQHRRRVPVALRHRARRLPAHWAADARDRGPGRARRTRCGRSIA